jgi:DNA-binding MarR family transcriptional regulator
MKKVFKHEYRPHGWFRHFRPLIAQLYGASCAIVYGELEWTHRRLKEAKKLRPDKSFYRCVDYIANDTGLSYNTVCRALTKLVKSGLVERSRESRCKPYFFRLPSIRLGLEQMAEELQGYPIIQFKDSSDDLNFVAFEDELEADKDKAV